jgi:hypothetical protein
MSNLYHPANNELPEIDFQFDKHVLNIAGESFPENPSEFWDPILNKVFHYLQAIDDQHIEVNCRLRYFGSGTVSKLYSLFRMLHDTVTERNRITLNWYHDERDDAVREFGEDVADAFRAIDCRVIAHSCAGA